VNIDEATMYITGMPCYMCAKMIVNAGLKEVWVATYTGYDEKVQDLFLTAGIEGGRIG